MIVIKINNEVENWEIYKKWHYWGAIVQFSVKFNEYPKFLYIEFEKGCPRSLGWSRTNETGIIPISTKHFLKKYSKKS